MLSKYQDIQRTKPSNSKIITETLLLNAKKKQKQQQKQKNPQSNTLYQCENGLNLKNQFNNRTSWQ